ncbi:unnamed protein product [Gordionus sp. m RMFG-2023]|uniref:nucleolar protein 6-like isoform X2 n=1 Tax=Gordionus sp. m RMFG-2023 TaxID=3053472 RepID=UPI0030E3ECB5
MSGIFSSKAKKFKVISNELDNLQIKDYETYDEVLNLLNLQIEEVCQQNKNYKYNIQIQEILNLFIKILQNIPESGIDEQNYWENINNKLDIFYTKIAKFDILFKPPQVIELIGSYTNYTFIKSDLTIDILTKMPSECFKENDKLNYQYFLKRMSYISYMGSQLCQKLDLNKKFKNISCKFYIEVGGLNNDGCLQFLPLLTIKMIDNSTSNNLLTKSQHFPTFRIIVLPDLIKTDKTMQSELFSNMKKFKIICFNPNKCNIKDDNLTSSPYYNSIISNQICSTIKLFDLTDIISNAGDKTYPVIDALILLKLWAKSRYILNYDDKFNNSFNLGHIFYIFMIWLYKTQKINQNMTPFQIFKLALFYINSQDWTKCGLHFYESNAKSILLSEEKIKLFHSHFDVVFLDPTGNYNICWNFTKFDYYWIKYEVELTLEQLNISVHPEPFHWLFMTQRPFELSFDHILRISVPVNKYKDRIKGKNILNPAIIDEDNGHIYRALKLKILSIIHQGLKDFVKLIVLKPEPFIQIPLNTSDTFNNNDFWAGIDCSNIKLTFGILLKPPNDASFTKSSNVFVIKGPQIDSDPKEEKNFIDFWGIELCSTRKFSDGTVKRAIVFDSSSGIVNGFDKRTYPYYRIVCHLLKRHCGFDMLYPLKNYVDYNQSRFQIQRMGLTLKFIKKFTSKVLGFKHNSIKEIATTPYSKSNDLFKRIKKDNYGTGESNFLPIIKATDSLCKILMEDLRNQLPLGICNVLGGYDSIFRRTEVFPPLPLIKPGKSLYKINAERKTTGTNAPNDRPIKKIGYPFKFRKYPTFQSKKQPTYINYTLLTLWPESTHKWPIKLTNETLNVKIKTKFSSYYRSEEKMDKNLKITRKQKDLNEYIREPMTYAGALSRLIIAFLIELKRHLAHKVDRCFLVKSHHLNNLSRNGNSQYHLEVMHSGYAFKLYFVCPPQLRLTTNLFEGLNVVQRLSKAILALHSSHPYYGLTTRLVKRWLAAHMLLSGHNEYFYHFAMNSNIKSTTIDDLWVDIFVSKLFLCPEPFPQINCPSLGFLRFLHCLSTFDFDMEPYFIPLLNSSLSYDDVTSIRLAFKAHRIKGKFPNIPNIVLDYTNTTSRKDKCTEQESDFGSDSQYFNEFINGSLAPSSQVFRRTLILARKVYENLLNEPCLNVNVSNDIIISRGEHMKNTFGHLALFFNDKFGGDIIGVVWKPNVYDKLTSINKNDISASTLFYQTPLNNSKMKIIKTDIEASNEETGFDLVSDINSIIEDMRIMGKGLIHTIECRTEIWNENIL